MQRSEKMNHMFLTPRSTYQESAASNHEKAAVRHDRAAEQHRKAAALHLTGNEETATEYARLAVLHGQRAQDSCTRAMEREGEEDDQHGSNAKRIYQRHAQ